MCGEVLDYNGQLIIASDWTPNFITPQDTRLYWDLGYRTRETMARTKSAHCDRIAAIERTKEAERAGLAVLADYKHGQPVSAKGQAAILRYSLADAYRERIGAWRSRTL